MKTFHIDDLVFNIGIKGETRYGKASFPVRYGMYSEVVTAEAVYQFNLNGEIKHVHLKDRRLMEPTEWLKRTMGNDWVFYSSGGYNGAFEAVGEYYVPCFPYESNGILGGRPFKIDLAGLVDASLEHMVEKISELKPHVTDPDLLPFCCSVSTNSAADLKKKADLFHKAAGGCISVLPPDARHVDYDVIPVEISRGCLYHCGFCTVKSGERFSRLPLGEIRSRISDLKKIYGKDIVNYNSVFLGQHDALHAGSDWIEASAVMAYDLFGFDKSVMKSPRLFLFASADSFLSSTETVFETLNRLPFYSYINIGLESADTKTLKTIGKPISVKKVRDGFSKMFHVNRLYPNIEVTANFLYGDSLPSTHMDEFHKLIGDQYPKPYSKGCVYLSPYGEVRDRKSMVVKFKGIKGDCHIPLYLYIIQRL